MGKIDRILVHAAMELDAPPTVFVVDNDPNVCSLLESAAASAGLGVAIFASGRDFLESFRPDWSGCLVLDVMLSVPDGPVLQRILRDAGIGLPIIMTGENADIALAVSALKAGAVDFLPKPLDEEQTLERIRDAIRLSLARRAQRMRLRRRAERFESLTQREEDVMRLLVQGFSGKEIAAALSISYKTVEKFRAKVMRKMRAGNLAELVLAAVSLGLVSPDQQAA